MNKKDWKDYQQYRIKRQKLWYKSEEYLSLLKEREELLYKINNPSFWEKMLGSHWGLYDLIMLDCKSIEKEKIFVGEETIEACLNWVINKK